MQSIATSSWPLGPGERSLQKSPLGAPPRMIISEILRVYKP
jgi:hypothetical protein